MPVSGRSLRCDRGADHFRSSPMSGHFYGLSSYLKSATTGLARDAAEPSQASGTWAVLVVFLLPRDKLEGGMNFRLMGMAATACLTLLTVFHSSPSYSQNLISEIEFRKNDLPVVVAGWGLPMRVQNNNGTEIDVVFSAPDGFLICDV